MKFLYAAILAMAPLSVGATTISLSGADLSATESTVAGEFGYVVDLFDLGFSRVSNVSIVDSLPFANAGNSLSGFDLDGLGIGASDTAIAAASNYVFGPGGLTSGARLFGALDGNTGVNEAFATLGTFDGTVSPKVGFLSLGRGGSIDASFDGLRIDATNRFLFIREVGTDERLGSISIDGVVPLPATALLLLSGLGGLAACSRRRKKS